MPPAATAIGVAPVPPPTSSRPFHPRQCRRGHVHPGVGIRAHKPTHPAQRSVAIPTSTTAGLAALIRSRTESPSAFPWCPEHKVITRFPTRTPTNLLGFSAPVVGSLVG